MIILLFTAIGLSLDSFSLSVAIGLVNRENKIKNSLILATCQTLMYIVGYILSMFISVDFHFGFKLNLISLVFFILGVKLIFEFFKDEEFTFKQNEIYKIALLTSVDAILIGITGLGSVVLLSFLIFICTFIFVMAGLYGSKVLHVIIRNEKYSLILAGIIMFVLSYMNLK